MIVWSKLTNAEQIEVLSRPALAQSEALAKTVAEIMERVRLEGDTALSEFTERFDGVRLDDLSVPSQDLITSESELAPAVKDAIDRAYDNIRRFHEAQRPADLRLETSPGVVCEQRHAPLASVGLYVPAGTAPLPSTVLMLGVAAQAAGCPRKVLCTPPDASGHVAAEIRYAARLCEITEIYRVGGAQAVAAMAFGTQRVGKVDKIFGPGNSYVTEAKQQASRIPGGPAIDMPAGPSEVLVIADADANPVFVAADLLSQAEHGTDSQAVLVSDSPDLIAASQAEVTRQLHTLSRRDIAAQAMNHGRYILTSSLDESIQVSNRYAPEHLIVQVNDARACLADLRNAGSIFLGPWSPESAGDYASGTNHVLPTYGYARNYSSLGLLDFMRRYTIQELSQEGLQDLGPAIMALADAEGLDAHRQAVALRLEVGKEQKS